MLRVLDRGLNRLYIGCGYLAAFCLAMICPMVVANIVGRWIGIFVPGTNEIAGYLMAASGALGLAYSFGQNGHIRVTVLIGALQGRTRRVVDAMALLISLMLIGYLSYYLVHMVMISYDFEDRSLGTDNILLWIPQLPMVIGFLIFSISLLHSVLRGLFFGSDFKPDLDQL